MARVAYFFTRRLLHRVSGRRPQGMLAPLELYAHVPRLLTAYGALEAATSARSALRPRHRALAELKAATLTSCEYCIDLGSQVARQWGLTDEEIADLPQYVNSDRFGHLDKLILDYATGISSTPAQVDDRLVTLLLQELTAPQLVELTHLIALENHRGRFNLALGVPAAGFSQGQVCALPPAQPRAPYYATVTDAPHPSRTAHVRP